MSAQTTATLTNEMQTFYESTFLARAENMRVYEEGAQKKTHQANSGKLIYFTRYSPLATVTTPLTEGANPSEVDITGATVSATLAEYGSMAKISKLLSLTSIDRNAKEKIELFGQNMGETFDELTRDALVSGGTSLLGGSATTVSDVAASDTLSANEIRRVVNKLEIAKAMRYSDGFYMGKVVPQTKYNLIADSTWVNAKTYSDVKDLYKGEIGELYGVRFLLGTNAKTSTQGSVTTYYNIFHGKEAFGCVDLSGDKPRLFVKMPNENDTSNPADRYSTIAWAGSWTCVALNANWIQHLRTRGQA